MNLEKVKQWSGTALQWLRQNKKEVFLAVGGFITGTTLTVLSIKQKEREGSTITVNDVDYDLPSGSHVNIKF